MKIHLSDEDAHKMCRRVVDIGWTFHQHKNRYGLATPNRGVIIIERAIYNEMNVIIDYSYTIVKNEN